MQKHSWHKVHLNLQSNSLPVPRWGHSCCVIGNQIVLFGGYAESVYMNDIWTFNTTTMQWTQIKTTGDIPSQRSNCSMSYDSQNDRIIVFGGGGPNKKRFNTINILNWMSKQWVEIYPRQNEPGPWERTYHCAELLYPYLVVFGGEGVTDMDDLWVFNFETMGWKEVPVDKTKPRPCGRRFHSSAIVGSQFFVIGGCHGKYRCLSDVFSLDLTPLIREGDIQRLQWRDRKPLGSAFLTRWGHSSAVYDNKIYIFGGRFSNDLNDLLVLDLQKNTIKALKIVAQLPKARRRHSACFIGSCMIIFGGFNGEYYNDLYYINAFQLRSKLQLSQSTYNKNIELIINKEKYSDSCVMSSQEKPFYLQRGLLFNGLRSEERINDFLKKISGKLNEKELYELVGKIYKGFGSLNENEKKYEFQLPESQQDYQQIIKSELLREEETLQSPVLKKQLLPTIIPLNETQFSEFLDQNRQKTYKDCSIIINNSYLLRTNSIPLILNSKFFKNVLNQCFKKNSQYSLDNIGSSEKQVKISINSNNLVIFEILINYLLLDKVVIPADMGLYSWMQLYEMSDYFCIQRLKLISQQQICSFVNQKNCQQILGFAIEMKMKILSLFCGDCYIKSMVNHEEKYFYEETQCALKNSLIQSMYNLARFDILQVKLQRMKNCEEGLKKKESHSTSDDKENYQINNSTYPLER